ncbi:MAG: hypothetical protein ACE5JI_06520, partial [Acidobacteriota bacterium]
AEPPGLKPGVRSVGGSSRRSIGLDFIGGTRKNFQTAGRQIIEARLHEVRLHHEELGTFDLEVAFSDQVFRNLLGRDFFNLIQIGFRERRLEFYVTPRP